MPRNHFLYRKSNQLKKQDKSLKQSWDKKIIPLCEKINSKKEFYTTSSCSGRILILKESDKKTDKLFIFRTHELTNFNEIKKALKKIKYKGLIYYRLDPCIIHIAANTLENSQKIHDLGKKAGWKRCGIIATNKRFVVELNASYKIELPIMFQGKILVDNEYLKFLVKESDRKLKKCWDVIRKLEGARNDK